MLTSFPISISLKIEALIPNKRNYVHSRKVEEISGGFRTHSRVRLFAVKANTTEKRTSANKLYRDAYIWPLYSCTHEDKKRVVKDQASRDQSFHNFNVFFHASKGAMN